MGPEKLLKVLKELLNHEDIEVRPYANGILYATLQDKRVWDYAHKINLSADLTNFSESLKTDSFDGEGSDPNEIKRQFDYILKQLQKSSPPRPQSTENSSDDEIEDEDDIIEPDLDANDLEFNGQIGEEFLNNIDQVVGTFNNGVYNKPMPVSSRSNSRNSMRQSNIVSKSSTMMDELPSESHKVLNLSKSINVGGSLKFDDEYAKAFSSTPSVPRTPDVRDRRS